MTRALVLTHDRSYLAYRRPQNAVILPELLLEDFLNIEAVHDRLLCSIFRSPRGIKHQNDVIGFIVDENVSYIQLDVVTQQQ